MASEPGQGTETDKKVLTVGLFKYVPDIQAFETALTTQWKDIEPDVALRFVDWDCYFEEPKSDVFVFDGLYASQYIEKGLLYPLGESIPARSAYPAWTLEQASSQGIYYGIPQMVCMDTLFYRKDDQAVARVQTMQQLYDAIGPRKTQALLPGRDEGVIADFSLNNEMKYYNILQDHTGKVVPVQAMGNV
ncbi:extracellular solute-binding protein, partial [Megasphaera sp.]